MEANCGLTLSVQHEVLRLIHVTRFRNCQVVSSRANPPQHTEVRKSLGKLHSMSGVPESDSWFHVPVQFAKDVHPGREQQLMTQVLGSPSSMWESWTEIRVLPLAWSYPTHWGHLGSESVGRKISFSLFL